MSTWSFLATGQLSAWSIFWRDDHQSSSCMGRVGGGGVWLQEKRGSDRGRAVDEVRGVKVRQGMGWRGAAGQEKWWSWWW